MSTTFRQLLNRVLSNASEEEVSSGSSALSTAYEKLVRNFVNHFLAEVQDAHNWSCMRKTCLATVTGGNGYSSNFQNASEDISPRSRLARQAVHGVSGGLYLPLAFDVTEPNYPYQLTEADLKEVVTRQNTSPTTANSEMSFANDPQANAVITRVWPVPTGDRSLSFEFYVPQERFEGTTADIDTLVNLPPRAVDAVELGATWYVYDERGEELGPNSMFSQARYTNALNAAIERDDTEGSGNDYDLVVV